MKKIIALLSVAAFSTAAFAQSTWKVDKAHARVTFTITHMAVSDVDGSFKDFDATISASKPDFSDAKFDLSIKTTSVNTDNDQRDNHLKTAEFFDAANKPTLTFVSTGIASTGTKDHYKVTGNLTLGGVTKAATFDLWYRGTLTNPGKPDDAGFQVTGTIKRSDFNFGSKYGQPMLGDEVTIKANGEFIKSAK